MNEPTSIVEVLYNWNQFSEIERNQTLSTLSDTLKMGKYPVYLSDTKVMLLYYEPAGCVQLISDITGWTDPISFTKLDNVDLFYLILDLESDARIEYLLIVDQVTKVDPYNKYQSLNGLGSLSELAMPHYQRHPYHSEYLYGKEGSYEGLIKHILPQGSLPYEHEVYVYLPADYNEGKKYPAVYFQDGPDYIRFALAPLTLRKLVQEKIIEPCIGVFVTPPNLHKPASPNRSTEYGLNDNYTSFFCNELVSFIDREYSTISSPEMRLVCGDSYAGLISLYISFSRPDLFSNVYSQSGYFSFQNDRMIKMIRENEKKNINVFMDIGTYERKVGADFLPATELDFTTANRRMNNELTVKGYDFIYKEYPEGHTWGNWRRHLIDALIHFFQGEKLK